MEQQVRVAGKIPAVNGGVNRSVYGFDSGSVNVRTYLGDAKKAVPKKCGDDFRDALAALKNEPRGLVFWGFKNHIEGSQGSDRFRDSIVDYCNFLIDDVRQYSEFTANKLPYLSRGALSTPAGAGGERGERGYQDRRST